jgi:hypothetical protein
LEAGYQIDQFQEAQICRLQVYSSQILLFFSSNLKKLHVSSMKKLTLTWRSEVKMASFFSQVNRASTLTLSKVLAAN